MNDDKLPAELLERADLRANEPAWRRDDLPQLAEKAKALSFACLGGQVQFRFDDSTCELYWLSYDPAERWPNETWQAFVQRSWDEMIAKLNALPDNDAIICEARKNFTTVTDADLSDGPWFVTYPISRSECEP